MSRKTQLDYTNTLIVSVWSRQLIHGKLYFLQVHFNVSHHSLFKSFMYNIIIFSSSYSSEGSLSYEGCKFPVVGCNRIYLANTAFSLPYFFLLLKHKMQGIGFITNGFIAKEKWNGSLRVYSYYFRTLFLIGYKLQNSYVWNHGPIVS